jgi:hypothetical protein
MNVTPSFPRLTFLEPFKCTRPYNDSQASDSWREFLHLSDDLLTGDLLSR